MRAVFLCSVVVLGCIINAITPPPSGRGKPSSRHNFLKDTIQCFKRGFNLPINKDYQFSNGTVIPCRGRFLVQTCWGRCDTSEVPDYKVPYKIVNHSVCTYGGKKFRRVRLKQCGKNHPDPFFEVFDATHCVCAACNDTDTSCESLNG